MRVASLSGGALYTFSTFHFEHAQAQLHISSMYWPPLFILFTRRALLMPSIKYGLVCGAILGVALLASPYQFLFALVAALLLLFQERRHLLLNCAMGSILLTASAAVASFALSAGWWLIGALSAYSSESYVGGHDSTRFSADLLSFFLPHITSVIGSASTASLNWTGTPWEAGCYIGYSSILLGLYGSLTSAQARRFLLVAACGALLAMGPALHVNGHVYTGLLLPTGVLERLIPGFAFSGLPVRFAWLVTFGFSFAAGAGVHHAARASRARTAMALFMVGIGVAEHWPTRFTTSTIDVPPEMALWASDPTQWAVIDATSWSEQLRHQMIHKHPIVGGYVTRVPSSMWTAAASDSLLMALMPPPLGAGQVSTESVARLSAEEVRASLQRFGVRYVVAPSAVAQVLSNKGLVMRYENNGVSCLEYTSSDIHSR
jgi:hypothetical protein